MTEESRILRLLDRGYTLIWREGQLEQALSGLDEDFEWEAVDYPGRAAGRGPETTIEFFREWNEAWEDLDVEWELHALDPSRALVFVHMRGRSRGGGVPTEMHFGQIWTLSDGRFKRMTMYTDVDQARRAAGLA